MEPDLTLPQRGAAKVLEGIGRTLWGFNPRLMPHIAADFGAGQSLLWFASNMPEYERILSALGPRRTHLLTTTTSLINGCRYCAYGHGYAYQLHYFEETGELFPVDENSLLDLIGTPDVLASMQGWMAEHGSTEEQHALVRLAEIRGGAEASTPLDRQVAHLDSMMNRLNACGIKGEVDPDEAHDPINRNDALRARYHAARSA